MSSKAVRRYEQVLAELESASDVAVIAEKSLALVALWPAFMAEMRRRANLTPVRVNGSRTAGLRAGYFSSRLRDGTVGYFGRRVDECLTAAFASLLQVPLPVPDLRLDQQVTAGRERLLATYGNDEELALHVEMLHLEIGAAAWEQLSGWVREQGLTIVLHEQPLPVDQPRWIGVVSGGQESRFSDHCLVMTGRDVLFDPMSVAGEIEHQLTDVDYGLTLERTDQ
jgi:hypothetical protein